MKDSSSAFLVILVLLVTLIGGGAALYPLKRPVKLELFDVDDLTYIEILPIVDIQLALEGIEEELDFATSCYRVDLK